MKTFEGLLTVTNEKFCIVVSRFNEFIGGKLLSGAIDELKRHGVEDSNIDVVWCPGAFEIPLVAKKCAKTGKYSAIITLGAVIKGSTSHYDYVCAEVSKGVATVERAGTKAGNKGADAAKSAIEMANLMQSIN